MSASVVIRELSTLVADGLKISKPQIDFGVRMREKYDMSDTYEMVESLLQARASRLREGRLDFNKRNTGFTIVDYEESGFERNETFERFMFEWESILESARAENANSVLTPQVKHFVRSIYVKRKQLVALNVTLEFTDWVSLFTTTLRICGEAYADVDENMVPMILSESLGDARKKILSRILFKKRRNKSVRNIAESDTLPGLKLSQVTRLLRYGIAAYIRSESRNRKLSEEESLYCAEGIRVTKKCKIVVARHFEAMIRAWGMAAKMVSLSRQRRSAATPRVTRKDFKTALDIRDIHFSL